MVIENYTWRNNDTRFGYAYSIILVVLHFINMYLVITRKPTSLPASQCTHPNAVVLKFTLLMFFLMVAKSTGPVGLKLVSLFFQRNNYIICLLFFL